MSKKATVVTQADIDAAGPRTEQRRRVIYTIMVTGLTDRVKLDKAQTALEQHQVSPRLMHISADNGTISVPRILTLWQGDVTEKAWQQAIKEAAPGTVLIDVKDWEPAPGYPTGEIGDQNDG